MSHIPLDWQDEFKAITKKHVDGLVAAQTFAPDPDLDIINRLIADLKKEADISTLVAEITVSWQSHNTAEAKQKGKDYASMIETYHNAEMEATQLLNKRQK